MNIRKMTYVKPKKPNRNYYVEMLVSDWLNQNNYDVSVPFPDIKFKDLLTIDDEECESVIHEFLTNFKGDGTCNSVLSCDECVLNDDLNGYYELRKFIEENIHEH